MFFSIQAEAGSTSNPVLELQRQEQRQLQLRKKLEQNPDVRLPRKTAPIDTEIIPDNETPCFNISRIILDGQDTQNFNFALKAVTEGNSSAIGRCLGIQGINAVMTRVQNAIIAKGFVTTRVLTAPQDIKSGELILTIIPGRIRDIRFSPETSSHGNWKNAFPARSGDLLNIRDIEQALENMKRPPTADADIKIEPSDQPGAQPGESDIVIKYKQVFPLRFTMSLDDGGSENTGQYQSGITLSGDNLLSLNDLFYISINKNLGIDDSSKHGTRGGTLHYSLPFGYWLLGFTASKNSYDQTVIGFSQNYLYSGDSGNGEVKLSRLVYRDAARKTTVSISGYLKTSRNYVDDTEVQVQRRRMSGWQASLNHHENIGSTTLDINLSFRRGTRMLNALPATEELFDEGTAKPKIINVDTTLNLPFTIAGQRLRLKSNWRRQWNRTQLISQDSFSIGGRYTVRGFDGENTLLSERGWLLRNDLGWTLGDSGSELYLGIDYGKVGGAMADLLTANNLAGAVLGLRGGYKGFSWDIFAGGALNRPDGWTGGGVGGFNLSWTY